MTIQFVDGAPLTPPSSLRLFRSEKERKIISLNVLIQHDESCIQLSGVNN